MGNNPKIALLTGSVVALAGMLAELMPERPVVIIRQKAKSLPPPPNCKAERRKALRVAAMKEWKAKNRRAAIPSEEKAGD